MLEDLATAAYLTKLVDQRKRQEAFWAESAEKRKTLAGV